MSYDIIGSDEIIGADEDELLDEILSGDDDDDMGEIGADEEIAIGARGGARARARKRAIARKLALRNAALVKSRGMNRMRKYLLGLNSLAVGAGAAATVNSQPQYPFRPYRFVVPSTFAPNFVINSIFIGQQPVFVAAANISAEVFSEVAWGTEVLWDTASIGNQVSLQITSLAAAAADFRGAMFGVTAKD